MPGRVGDSPIIGAGTYANNASCAVSGTGVGEYFIRLNLARSICDLVEYKGMTVQAAADEELHTVLPMLKGGEGGVIVIAPGQDPVWSFNTVGMFRARMVEGGDGGDCDSALKATVVEFPEVRMSRADGLDEEGAPE